MPLYNTLPLSRVAEGSLGYILVCVANRERTIGGRQSDPDMRDQLQQNKELESEFVLTQRLHRMTLDVIASQDVQAALGHVLTAAIELHRADFGNIQLFDPPSRTLRIAAQRGFSQPFLERFASVDAEDGSGCGRALRHRRTTQISDVLLDDEYEPYRVAAAEAGYRALQSAPLIGTTGDILGVLSVHFRQPHEFSERDRQLGDVLGHQAAELIAHHIAADARRLAEHALRRSELKYRTLFDSIDQGFCTIDVLYDAGAAPLIIVLWKPTPRLSVRPASKTVSVGRCAKSHRATKRSGSRCTGASRSPENACASSTPPQR